MLKLHLNLMVHSTGCSWCRFSRILYLFSIIHLYTIYSLFSLKKYIETTLPTPRFKKALCFQSFWWGESVHIYTRQAPFCYTGCSFRWRLWGRITSSHAIIMPCIPFCAKSRCRNPWFGVISSVILAVSYTRISIKTFLITLLPSWTQRCYTPSCT